MHGFATQAQGGSSVGIGRICIAGGGDSVAIGSSAQTTQSNSIAIGSSPRARAINSITIGTNAVVDDAVRVDTVVIGNDTKCMGYLWIGCSAIPCKNAREKT